MYILVFFNFLVYFYLTLGMHKSGSDPKVKKTLVRNCERKIKPTAKKQVVHDVGSSSRAKTAKSSASSTNELNQPTLCSSEALAHHLSDAKISTPPPLTVEDLNVDRGQICAKITKKLNFHFNDRIYRNLIELNSIVEDPMKKKEKRPFSTTTKKDLEPNIEDFYEEVKENDSPANIPIIKPKFYAVKEVENGQLHKLVAAFENL